MSEPDNVSRSTALSVARKLIAAQTDKTVSAETTFDFAMQYALYQFAQTLRPQSMSSDLANQHVDEDTTTASLIGFLSSTLGWVGLIELLSGSPPTLPAMSWGYQSKTQESRTGGDFGLAVEIDNGQLGVAFFQAKYLRGSKLDINRVPVAYREESLNGERIRKDADYQLSALIAALPELGDFLQGGHQIAKLALTQRTGQRKANNENCAWVHYVAWSATGAAPLIVPLDNALEQLRATCPCIEGWPMPSLNVYGWSKAQIEVGSQDSHVTLATQLSQERIRSAEHWLHVDASTAAGLIGSLKSLGASWYLFGQKSGGAADLAEALNHTGDFDKLFERPTLFCDADPVQALDFGHGNEPTLERTSTLRLG
jgi:hypothetical protein